MKIGIDLSQITEHKTGIEYYTHQILKSLITIDKTNKYLVYTNNKNYLSVHKNLPKNFKIVEIASKKPNIQWIFKVVRNLRKNKVDLFISPSYFMFGVFFKNTIQFIHDIAPIKYPEFWPKSASLKFKIQLKLASIFTKLFAANSEYTKKDFVNEFKNASKKTHVIGTGLTDWVYSKPNINEQSRVVKKYNLNDKFFLSVSTIQPRKNYVRTIKAFANFLKYYPNFNYYIAGKKGWHYSEIYETVKELNLEDKVIFLGYVPEKDIAPLFDLSSAIIYCSVMEGFGLPVIEAYARDVPVVASNLEVIKQTMEDKVIYANPLDIESITEGMKKSLIYNTSVDSKFIKNLHWDNVADKLIKLYKNIDK